MSSRNKSSIIFCILSPLNAWNSTKHPKFWVQIAPKPMVQMTWDQWQIIFFSVKTTTGPTLGKKIVGWSPLMTYVSASQLAKIACWSSLICYCCILPQKSYGNRNLDHPFWSTQIHYSHSSLVNLSKIYIDIVFQLNPPIFSETFIRWSLYLCTLCIIHGILIIP